MFFAQLLSLSRFFIILASLSTFIASIVLLLSSTINTIDQVISLFKKWQIGNDFNKKLALFFIQSTDIFLIAIVLFIISIGLFELFIKKTGFLPSWLKINTLDDLKDKLVSVIIVILAVLFLNQAIEGKNVLDLLYSGAAITLVIASLTWFLSLKRDLDKEQSNI